MFRSVSHIYVQVIDDMTGRTIASASTRRADGEGRAAEEGDAAATSPAPRRSARRSPSGCIEKGVKRVVFDRNGFLYHGRVKAVADAAREAGLEF